MIKILKSSSAGEFHPHALTEPDVNLSIHPALIVQSCTPHIASNDFILFIRFLPIYYYCSVDQSVRLDNTTPLLSSHYRSSLLLRVVPPLCPASVLSLLWGFHLSFSLSIRTTGSHVLHKSPVQGHATFMPDAAQAVNRYLLSLSKSRI